MAIAMQSDREILKELRPRPTSGPLMGAARIAGYLAGGLTLAIAAAAAVAFLGRGLVPQPDVVAMEAPPAPVAEPLAISLPEPQTTPVQALVDEVAEMRPVVRRAASGGACGGGNFCGPRTD